MKTTTTQILSACLALLAVSHAHAQATLYGIGDLSGGAVYSEVRDATKTGGVIYAVGGSSDSATTSDRAVLWTSTGGLSAITDFVANTTSSAVASAITPDAAYIAARLHNSSSLTQTQAALVSTSSLSSPTALGVLGAGWPSNANGISDNGSILWGSAQYSSTAGLSQLVRFSSSGNSITAIPLVSGTANNFIVGQAAVSSDGNKVVGVANTSGGTTSSTSRAFLYINDTNDMSTVPLLTGGSWNAGLALNSAGTLGLVVGNSTSFSNGQLYLYNDTTTTLLGSPNAAYSFAGGGSLNSDGSLVTAAFNNGSANIGYIRNANGWYALDSVASTLGANMTGWSNLNIFGMSPDGTLVWGNGNHSGNTEGFVLEFSAGALTAIPEPSTYAAFAGLGALGLAVWRRKKTAA